MNYIFFELIQVALGTRKSLSHRLTEKEWVALYDMAKSHALLGICYAGIQNLETQDQTLPSQLFLKWMGIAAKIQQKNETINRQCDELQARFINDGFKVFIMKGQSVGACYGPNLSNLRQSGDIDIFVDGGRTRVLEYVQSTAPTDSINEIELSYRIFSDTDVDLHYDLPNIRNPFRCKKLHTYLNRLIDLNFEFKRPLSKDIQINCPVWEYDMVFQLVHIYDHFIGRGVGLRQIMDFYFLIKSMPDSADIELVRNGVKSIGLDKFASGIIWLIVCVFLNNNYTNIDIFPWDADKREGEFLLQEVLTSGNFGHGNENMNSVVTNTWKRAWIVNANTFRYWRYDHWAWFWSPLWRIYHFVWKRLHGFKK